MIDRQGSYISYPGCVEVSNGVFISDDGEVYIYDQDGEVASWAFEELTASPKAAAAAMRAISLATKRGPSAVRRNAVDRGNTLGEVVKQVKYAQGQR